MPIYVWIDADPASCNGCAAALKQLSDGIDREAGKFGDAKNKSESEWDNGEAGDRFRDKVDSVRTLAGELGGKADAGARALSAFADDIVTAMNRMGAAAELAARAGIDVTYVGGHPMFIMDPEPPEEDKHGVAIGPGVISPAESARYAKQVDAYHQAVAMAGEARGIEERAHAALRQALLDNRSAIDDLGDDLRASAPWNAAYFTTCLIGEAVRKHDEWTEVARTRAAAVQLYREQALSSISDTVKRSAIDNMVKLSGGVDSTVFGLISPEDAAAFNKGLSLGTADNWIGKGFKASLTSEESAHLPKAVTSVGSKLPAVGAVLTTIQTGYEIDHNAHDGGDVARIVTKNTGGYVAGSLATAVLAGTFGAPVLVSVGAGVVAGYLVGFGIDQAMK